MLLLGKIVNGIDTYIKAVYFSEGQSSLNRRWAIDNVVNVVL